MMRSEIVSPRDSEQRRSEFTVEQTTCRAHADKRPPEGPSANTVGSCPGVRPRRGRRQQQTSPS